MSRCCKIQNFCVPVECDLSMTLSRAKSFSVSSAEEFLSEIEPLIMRPRNWSRVKRRGDETWPDFFETEKGVVFIDLPLTMTIERDFSALNSTPTQVKTVMH